MMARSSALSLAVLILLLLVASNEGATGGGVCTEGFMDLSLLVAKAATPVGSLADNTLAENNEGRWIPRHNTLSCSTANVTEVLFGVDIRSEYGNRNKYPTIELWQFDSVFPQNYQKIETFPIVLSPDNVTTNGLYRYVLPTPFSVSGSNYNTYRLGVYQPEDDSSVVRLYRATASSGVSIGTVKADSISDTNIILFGGNSEINFAQTTNVFMIHLKTNPPNCFQNFFTESEINTNSLSVTSVIPVSDTRAFPDIQFTCNGTITKWIIGITQNQDTSKHYPNIYLKRSSELIHALTVDASAATSSNGNVYNFTSDIEVQYGDILIINVTTNSNPMYYQQYNGPLNYQLDSSNGLIPLERNDYPLISAVVESISAIPSNTVMSSTKQLMNTMNTNRITSSSTITITTSTPSRTVTGISTATNNKTSFLAYSTGSSTYNMVLTSSSSSTFYTTPRTKESTETSIKPFSTILSTISIGTRSKSTTMMSTPVSTPAGSTGSSTLILAGAISSFSTLILLLIAIVLIVIVLLCKRRWNKKTNRNHAPQGKLNQVDKNQNTLSNISTNPAYGTGGKSRCNTIDVSINLAYDNNNDMNTEGVYESISEFVYDEPKNIKDTEEKDDMIINEAYEQVKEEEEELYI